MHIVQVLAALSVGGSQLVAVELCEYLKANGHQVTVIASDGLLSKRINDCGATHLNWAVGKKRLSTLKLIKPLRTWLLQQQADVIHVHSRLPAWIVYQAIKKLPKPPSLVTSMHGHYSVNPYSAVMAKGDRVIAVSEHIRRYTLKQYPQTPAQQVVTIHGGVSDQDFPHSHQPSQAWLAQIYQQFPKLHGQRWLVLPGRITRWKGHIAFLQLLARLRQDNQPVQGLIIGPYRKNSSYFAELQQLCQQLNLTECITFTGSRDDMRDWYSAADVVFNLSDKPPEAFGRTVLEALKIGTPVLAWDQAGPAEQLEQLYPEGKVPLGDIQTLQEKTANLLQKPVIVPASSLFSLQQSMQKTLAVYQQAITGHGC